VKNDFTHEENFIDWLISLRRHFHQYPELSFKEFNSQKKIIEILNSFGIENKKIAATGVVGIIRGAEKGKTIAIRADMDALKIQEERTSLNEQYISLNEGIMHACGHDGHMAMVLGVARKLQEYKHKLKGNVKLIFQPAEEVPPGGAIEIIKLGELENIDAIIGAHVFTNIPSGEICLREGAFMAGNCMYNISIYGKSGHHASPDSTIDPILIAAEFISNIQSKLKENLPADVHYVFGNGTIKGGEQFNQTPDRVDISGSYRMLDEKNLHVIEDTMRESLDLLMKKFRKADPDFPNYKLRVTYGYPVLSNNARFTRRSAETLKTIFPNVKENIEPVFASEDFARYLELIPVTFIVLGAGNKATGAVYDNHSNRFDIDEKILITGVEVFFTLAVDFLNKPELYLEFN
jgi:amidohydrolase